MAKAAKAAKLQSCSSPETIRLAIDYLRQKNKNDGTVEAAIENLEAVLKTHAGKHAPLYRTVEEFEKTCKPSSRLPYAAGSKLLMPPNARFHDEMQLGVCHDGQTKLTLVLLEFVQRVYDNRVDKKRQVHLLYVGASSVAADAVRIAFPDMRQTIYDPASNMRTLMPPGYRKEVKIVTSTDKVTREPKLVAVTDFFTDDTCDALRSNRFIENELLLFVSDIRLDAMSETDIVKDMLNQQKWAVDAKCDWFMFKFRLPYDQKLLARYSSTKPGNMYYLSGDLMIQPYPPVGSVELRLVGQRRSNGLRSKHYDVGKLEDLLFAHNHFWRGNAVFEGGVSPYDLAVENKILARLDGDARKRVKATIDAQRRSAKKTNAAACALLNPGYRGLLGKRLNSQCREKVRKIRL
jgi:hypothetical protein